jgi:hypothetical protein
VSAFVINPYAFGGANITAFEFVTSATDNANATTYTFSSVSIGSADANRRVIVAFGCRAASSEISIQVSSATIAGESATVIVQKRGADDSGVGNFDLVAIVSATVASGSTGNIVVTLSQTAVRGAIAVYRAVSTNALTTIDTDTFGGGASASMSVDVEPNSIVIAVGASRLGGSGGHTWNLSNTDVNIGVESNAMTFSAASERPTTTTTKTYTASASTGFFIATAAASFK